MKNESIEVIMKFRGIETTKTIDTEEGDTQQVFYFNFDLGSEILKEQLKHILRIAARGTNKAIRIKNEQT